MPGFDRKGPTGEGPMTGRRFGRCTDFGAKLSKTAPPDKPENIPDDNGRRGFGMGRGGRGWGRGRGFRNWFRGGE